MKEERKTQPLQWLVDFANLDLERKALGRIRLSLAGERVEEV